MASGNSSSKRKSSSSHKKKPSKIQSEVKRRSRSRRGNKSKKIRRRDASLSYSDDDSRSKDSVSISSSDSEDDYSRSRRARSRTRRDEKGSRKRVRRSSSSSKGSRGSPHRRKKKGSKQRERSRDSKKKGLERKDKDGSLTRKKTHKVKRSKVRSRREKSVDSVSSDSSGSATCGRGDASSDEREFERSRGRSEGREKKSKRSSGKMSNGRDRSRSRSYSPRRGYDNENSYRSEERFSRDNHTKRFRSVLTVGQGSNDAEGRDYYKDDNKAEIIQDYDDYPSCRSNDSNDGGRKKDSFHHTHVVSEKKRKVDDLKIEEAINPKSRTTECSQSSNEDPKKLEASTRIDSPDGKDLESVLRQKALEKLEASTRIDSPDGKDLESVLRQKALEKFEASNGIDSSEGNDLESILRQKALENLKKFRGVMNTNMKTRAVRSHISDNGVKQPFPAKVDTTGTDKVAGKVAGSKEMASQDIKNVGMPTMERKSATSKDDGRILDKNHNQHESRAKLNTTHVVIGSGNSLLGQTVAGKASENNITNVSVVTDRATQDTSRIREKPSSDSSIVNQAPTTQNHHATEFIEPEGIVDKNVSEIPNAANGCSHAHVAETSKACESAVPVASSCDTPVTGDLGSNEQGDVAKESSQYEQKTMTVMRGGERVQVKYKVYIPNKTPALARRKLQR